MKRIDRRNLTLAQEMRFCHLDDVINGCQESGPSEAEWTSFKAMQAQRNANADDAALYGKPARN